MSQFKPAKFLKISAIATLMLLIYLPSKAQDKPFRLGLHFSPNFGWLKTDSDQFENDGSVFNYSYGLITELNFGANNNYALLSGLNVFNQSGAIKSGDTLQVKQKVQFIELPTVIKLKSNEVGYMTYFGKFGLSNKFKIAGEQEVGDSKINNKSDLLFFSASLLVGIGAEYNLSGNTSFVAGLDFHNGFTNLYKKKADEPSVKPYNITVSLGILF
ncbi:porin family protein [Luteibaculum oceani]|nr:porin family protein [Luteibaculum oceani]